MTSSDALKCVVSNYEKGIDKQVAKDAWEQYRASDEKAEDKRLFEIKLGLDK